MKYNIIFAFLKKDGSIETDFDDKEIYHKEVIEADRKTEALRKFYKEFEEKPEIIEIIKGE